MKTNYLVLVLCHFVIIAAMLGCQSKTGGIGSSVGPSSFKPVTTTSERVCYGGDACMLAIPAQQIVDPGHDYVYADPAKFPTVSLRDQYLIPMRFFDLSQASESAAISANFIVSDYMNVTHGRYAIFSPEVIAIMQKIRDSLGRAVYITSGYRSPGRNNATDGSAQWSRHMYGDAVDFSSASPNYTQLQTLCKQYDASFTLIYATHIHCDWRLHDLNSAFYDVGLTGHGFGDMVPEAHIEFDEDGSSVTVSVHTSEDDETDEGSLIYAWTITDARGVVTTSNEESVELPTKGAPYTIDVVVGGSIHLTQTWPQ